MADVDCNIQTTFGNSWTIKFTLLLLSPHSSLFLWLPTDLLPLSPYLDVLRFVADQIDLSRKVLLIQSIMLYYHSTSIQETLLTLCSSKSEQWQVVPQICVFVRRGKGSHELEHYCCFQPSPRQHKCHLQHQHIGIQTLVAPLHGTRGQSVRQFSASSL
jgi:hypothetical protein